MSKTLLILKNEIISTVSRKSFLFTAFGIPLIAVLIFLAVSLLRDDNPGRSGPLGGSPAEQELRVEGYVDQSGLISAIHPDVPEGILLPYPDEARVLQALEQGEIAAYYVIPADYVATGDLIYVNAAYSIASTTLDQSWVMRRTIFANLLGNDAARIQRASHAMDVREQALAPPKVERDADNSLTFFVPYGTMIIIYFVLMMSASLLLNSVSEEKKNRVMEILLLSASPRQMLAGKIVGLGLLGLLQTLIWVGTSYTLLRVSGRTLSLPAEFELPISIVAWGILFFLLGYVVYASLMAGLGALAPSAKEASQAIIVVIWPLLIPMFFVVLLIEDAHGPIATALSLIPLTAPVAMMTRLAVGGIPAWQPFVSAALLALTAVLVVRVVARMFRAQALLSGQPLSARRFLVALLSGA